MSQAIDMKTISLVSPAFNEEDNVERCYEVVRALFENELSGYQREHIFVDNASSDRTVEILRDLADKDPAVKVVVNARNFGVFRSVFNGLKYATGDAVLVMLPVDLQDPPELLPEFVNLWEQGYEVVAGARTEREESFSMRSFRNAFYWIVNKLSDFEITQNVGEFQLLDRKVFDALMAHDDQYPYIRGMIASLGFKRIIVPYVWKERKRGLSKHNLPMLVDQALNGIFSFTRAPMRFCTIVGLFISIFCIGFALLNVLLFFVNPELAPRGVTTIITALFFLSGIQMFFIGMLGEYVTSIHNQVRRGPIVVERERINIDEDAA
ncbi:glycosyltransferase family 2 protein [Ruegeria sp.]|uniref:glycosyltransferase family 2 protein n=1 Tax=Ruegeria sp. TaxID=1879320 RepID=UPI002328D041|nr:glycosyltransferase family 2 protein [Ruegeria sp.]MDA7964140.1 glycosyltransferase family 2 protein [Ruegeria sp.]